MLAVICSTCWYYRSLSVDPEPSGRSNHASGAGDGTGFSAATVEPEEIVPSSEGRTLSGLRVVVSDTTGQAIVGATVLAGRSGGLTDWRSTDDAGCALLGEGVCDLRCGCDGYCPQHIRVPPDATHLKVLLRRGAVVEGRVVDGAGAPLAGVSLVLSIGGASSSIEAQAASTEHQPSWLAGVMTGRHGRQAYSRMEVTDSEGTFVFRGVESGVHCLTWQKEGYIMDRQDPQGRRIGGVTLDVREEQRIQVHARMQAVCVVAIKVLNRTGLPPNVFRAFLNVGFRWSGADAYVPPVMERAYGRLSKEVMKLVKDGVETETFIGVARRVSDGASCHCMVTWRGAVLYSEVIQPESRGAAAGSPVLVTVRDEAAYGRLSIRSGFPVRVVDKRETKTIQGLGAVPCLLWLPAGDNSVPLPVGQYVVEPAEGFVEARSEFRREIEVLDGRSTAVDLPAGDTAWLGVQVLDAAGRPADDYLVGVVRGHRYAVLTPELRHRIACDGGDYRFYLHDSTFRVVDEKTVSVEPGSEQQVVLEFQPK